MFVLFAFLFVVIGSAILAANAQNFYNIYRKLQKYVQMRKERMARKRTMERRRMKRTMTRMRMKMARMKTTTNLLPRRRRRNDLAFINSFLFK